MLALIYGMVILMYCYKLYLTILLSIIITCRRKKKKKKNTTQSEQYQNPNKKL